MFSRPVKLLALWNAVLSALLLGSLAVNAVFVQASNDPPAEVFTSITETVGGDGSSTTNPVVITGTSPQVLTSVVAKVDIKHNHVCVVTGTADVSAALVGSQGSNVIFGLSMDTNTATDAASDRRVAVEPSGVRLATGATTFAYFGLQGKHTFYLSARLPNTSFNDQPTVNSASITVVCLQKKV